MLIFEDVVVVVEVTRWAWMLEGGEEHFYARDFEASTVFKSSLVDSPARDRNNEEHQMRVQHSSSSAQDFHCPN
jgi:hypothetical protein